MFFEMPKNIDFPGYADDNTPYTCSSNIEEVIENLQGALEQLFRWFSANHLVEQMQESVIFSLVPK